MESLDPSAFVDLTPLGLLAFFTLALVKIALNQADKRASVAEEREKVCGATLAATVPTMAALTEEVRKNNADGRERTAEVSRRLDDGARRLSAMEVAVRELVQHARGDPR